MTVRILQGHCLDLLRSMPDESVQCVVTSPPYWSLRDYGTQPVPWGPVSYAPLAGLDPCVHVPAQSASLGLETTLEAFIGHMVMVFREVRRVLRSDGVAWVNMGDSYAGSRCGGNSSSITDKGRDESVDAKRSMTSSRRRDNEPIPRSDLAITGLKPKDLIGQPWRLAFALQADGWWLRQDVVWEKLNPMPESVSDRCTKAHEFIFMLTKSERYWSDFEAIKEKVSGTTHARLPGNKSHKGTDAYAAGDESHRTKGGLVAYAERQRDAARRESGRKLEASGSGTKNNASFDEAMAVMPTMRNMRDVWPLATEPYREAHFATFPTEIPRRCILATCPVGGVVLDPFNGSGTTGQVAHELGRQYIGLELSEAYVTLTENRLRGITAGLALEVAA